MSAVAHIPIAPQARAIRITGLLASGLAATFQTLSRLEPNIFHLRFEVLEASRPRVVSATLDVSGALLRQVHRFDNP
jgi:hypothetical protein